MPRGGRACVWLVFLALGGVLVAGCGGEPVPEEPEGSFSSETVQLEETAGAGRVDFEPDGLKSFLHSSDLGVYLASPL